jgi:hypothetical protein
VRSEPSARRWRYAFSRRERDGALAQTAVVALSGVSTREARKCAPETAEVVEVRGTVAAVLPGGDHNAAQALIELLRREFPGVRAGYAWSDGQASIDGLLHVARQSLATGRQDTGISRGPASRAD